MKTPTSRKRKIKVSPVILWRASFLILRASRRHKGYDISDPNGEGAENPWSAASLKSADRYMKTVKGHPELDFSLLRSDLDQVQFMSRWVQRRCYYSPKQWVSKFEIDFYTATRSYQPQKLVVTESFEIRHPIGPSKRDDLIREIQAFTHDTVNYDIDSYRYRLIAVIRADEQTMAGLHFNKVLLRFVRNNDSGGWSGGDYEAVTILESE